MSAHDASRLFCCYCREYVSPPHRCDAHVSRLQSYRDVYARVTSARDNPRCGVEIVQHARRSFKYPPLD